MDTELDPFDELLTVPGGGPRKFKPTVKARPKPRAAVVRCSAPNTSKEEHAVSNPTVQQTTQENSAEVTDVSLPSVQCASDASKEEHAVLNSAVQQASREISAEVTVLSLSSASNFVVGDSEPLANVEEPPSLVVSTSHGHAFSSDLVDPFDDLDLTAAGNVVGGGPRKFKPVAKARPKPRAAVGRSSAPDASKDRPAVSDSAVKQTTQEKSAEVTDLRPPTTSNSVADSDPARNVQEPPNLGVSTSRGFSVPPDLLDPPLEQWESFDNDLLDGVSISAFPSADDSEYGTRICQASASMSENDQLVETNQEIPLESVHESTPGEDTGTGTELPISKARKRKTRSNVLSEVQDGDLDESQGELLTDSAVGQASSIDNNEKITKGKRKGVRKSKKAAPEKEKPVRKRKKRSDTPSEQQEKPKKKFSHTTTRRRRKVNPALLDIKEEDLNPESIPLRDLILLAEHNERKEKIETSSNTRASNQRTEYSSPSVNIYGDQDNHDYDQQDDNVEIAVHKPVNYHSYMIKTPKAAWSKLDTELFYQGIRQFGTDFSMIAKLFHDRNRDQIKLKYKKEERQHPQRVSEAIENRATGISYFEQVIEQLKADKLKADKENEDLNNDLNGYEPNEDYEHEGTAEAKEDATPKPKEDDAEATDAREMNQESEKMDEYENDDENDDSGFNYYTSL